MPVPNRVAALALFAAALLSLPHAPDARAARLPSNVRPTFQAIHLALDPDSAAYSGTVRVDLEVGKPTVSVRFHAREMALRGAVLEGAAGRIALTTAPPDSESIVVATADREIPAGRYTLAISFENDFDQKASSLYRLKSGDSWYAFTQFEAIDARGAFPSWDEPSFKFPYQITLSIPEKNQAVSNTPVASETVVKGIRTITFAKTKPLPSYLLAIATGPLEFVPIPGLRVPGRVVVPKGSTGLTKVAVEMAPPIFNALERWFGMPYPYEKLDLIAVPEYAPGAMENPGAITYADRFLLFDERTMSASERRTLSTYTAHEIAHMWFGDLVTMKWWDDLWLNEAFAEWMGNKISDEVNPQFLVRQHALTEAQDAFELDAQLATRAIRQPVERMENLFEAANALTYKKGQTVLGMTERWLGPDVFRKGVIAYLKEHAHGNAEGADLWRALGAASGKDVRGVLASFLDQPGVPLIHATLGQDGVVTLMQKRFLNHGVEAPRPQSWKIPITLMYLARGTPRTLNVLLDKERTTVRLPRGDRPAWIHPNADEAGYYRWSVDPPALTRLVAEAPTALTVRERIGLVQNATALLESGAIHGDHYLEILAGFAGDANPTVISALATGLSRVKATFLTSENEASFAVYVRRVLGPALDRFGLDRKSGEEDAVSLVRPTLYAWLGDEGRDERVLTHAERLARSFLADRGSIDPSLVKQALALAATRGDSALFNEYRRRFETTDIPTDREPLLNALGSFRDPTLRSRALSYALTGPLRPQELFWVAGAVSSVPRQQDEAWTWWRNNYDALTGKMPPEYAMYVTFWAGGCSEERIKNAETFFANPRNDRPGTKALLARVAEGVRTCRALSAREGAAVNRTLERLAKAR
jgi:alanyl aminopeptidase